MSKGKTPEEITYDEMDERGEEDLADAYNNMGNEKAPRKDSKNQNNTFDYQNQHQYEGSKTEKRTNDGKSHHIKTKK